MAYLIAGAALLTAMGCVALLPGVSASVQIVWALGGCLIGLYSVFLGVLVTRHRPSNPVGVLLTLAGLAPCVVVIGDAYVAQAARSDALLPAASLPVTLSRGDWVLFYVAMALLPLYFPDGRLPQGRAWRLTPAAVVGAAMSLAVTSMLEPGPVAPPLSRVGNALAGPATRQRLWPILRPLESVLALATVALLLIAVAALVTRYRRADERERIQLRWVMLAAGGLPLALALCLPSYLLLHGPALAGIGLVATFIAVPTAVTIALLRHDLYDVDRAVAATVTYTLASSILLACYALASLLGALAARPHSVLVAAGTTGVCAAALNPLRTRVQHRVDRRLYPVRPSMLAAVEDLARRTHDGQARPEELEDTLRAVLHDPHLRVGYHPPGLTDLLAADGTPLDIGRTGVPVKLGGQQIGMLLPAGTVSRQVLREAAAACALLVEVVRLRIELNRALRDIEASRTRLVHSEYRERRRLERDLHDGAQQRLVSLGATMRLTQRHLHDRPADVNGLIDHAVDELATALGELRRIAHGLHPASLDGGLPAALTELVSGVPLPVTLTVYPGPLPDQVAATTYYIASEAVANALKHANATKLAITVERRGNTLDIRVEDDGAGAARIRPKAGLTGLADRVAAQNGTLHVTSPIGAGTILEAQLPCAP